MFFLGGYRVKVFKVFKVQLCMINSRDKIKQTFFSFFYFFFHPSPHVVFSPGKETGAVKETEFNISENFWIFRITV